MSDILTRLAQAGYCTRGANVANIHVNLPEEVFVSSSFLVGCKVVYPLSLGMLTHSVTERGEFKGYLNAQSVRFSSVRRRTWQSKEKVDVN